MSPEGLGVTTVAAPNVVCRGKVTLVGRTLCPAPSSLPTPITISADSHHPWKIPLVVMGQGQKNASHEQTRDFRVLGVAEIVFTSLGIALHWRSRVDTKISKKSGVDSFQNCRN